VQEWARQLRALAFQTVSGASGTIDRLDDLGLDLDRDGQLSIDDADKLDAALADVPTDVEAFFNTATTGFAAKFDVLLETQVDAGDGIQERYTATNSALDRQIADMERRLTQQRELLTNSFIAMESAQSRLQSQSAAITNAFGANTKS
jgi:flagellar hook-associated protein 2